MGVIEKLTTRRKAAAKGSNDTRHALSELRAMNARLREERAQTEARPVPLAEAQEAAAHSLLAEADRIVADLDLAPLMKPADGRAPSLRLKPERRAELAFVAGVETIAAAVSQRLADKYAQHGLTGLADDDRAAQLARIDADHLACECAEEATIRELEAAGFEVARRPDADPRALLAADADL